MSEYQCVQQRFFHACKLITGIVFRILIVPVLLAVITVSEASEDNAEIFLDKIGIRQGICVLLGDTKGDLAVSLVRSSRLQIYVQLPNDNQVQAVSKKAHKAKLYGTRIYVEKGTYRRIHLADNIADAVIVIGTAITKVSKNEIERILNPLGKAILGKRIITKDFRKGIDDWSHPYHGPDNNPQSSDQFACAPYITQFLGEPWYGPLPAVTVASGGRIFKAFGHIAIKRREWPWLNTLIALNAYNGTILWKRKLKPGFMIHRNTIIATPSILFMGDDTSCKLINTETGALQGEIIPPHEDSDSSVFKWMALENGVLYALTGKKEHTDNDRKGTSRQDGWGWGSIGRGYRRDKYPWGFGQTLIAVTIPAKRIVWIRRENEPLDSRAICMKNGRIYLYSHQRFLSCINAQNGEVVWKTTDRRLLEAIGGHDRAQTWNTGFSSSVYLKCNDKALYFAGPQRKKLVAVSAENGKLLWQYPDDGNFQLVLRDDALYAMGIGRTHCIKFDLLTGKLIKTLDLNRGSCTRATGAIDGIWVRAASISGSTFVDLANNRIWRIHDMRPGCMDGVIITQGFLYWGPWMCDCNRSLFGVICLGPSDTVEPGSIALSKQLEPGVLKNKVLKDLREQAADWPTYRSDNSRSNTTSVSIPERTTLLWTFTSSASPTAPVAVGNTCFISGSDGVVYALDSSTGRKRWEAYTGGTYPFSSFFLARTRLCRIG